jgi:hypothetical protein
VLPVNVGGSEKEMKLQKKGKLFKTRKLKETHDVVTSTTKWKVLKGS